MNIPSPAARPMTRRSIIVLALLLAACDAGGHGSGAAPSDSVAIGLGANVGRAEMTSVQRGAALAVEHLNARRPRGAAPFVLRTVPNTVTSAVEIATALRDDPSVIGVVGHTESAGTLEATPIYADAEHDEEHAVVAVSPTATSPVLSGRSRWLFRVCPSDVAASQAAARYARDSLRARRAIVMYRNDLYGREWSRAFTAAFRAGGGAVLRRDPHFTGMTEWDAYAGYIRQLAPDVVLFPGSNADAEPFIRALRAEGVRIPVLGGDAISELAAKGAEFNGTFYTAFFLPGQPGSARGAAFVSDYRKRYANTLPDQRAALSYDAAMVIGEATLAAGADRKAVRDYIAGIGSARPSMQGATGPIAFDERNDVVGKPVVISAIGR
jgi:branched-chain amino acid transport system substrate-binding protein